MLQNGSGVRPPSARSVGDDLAIRVDSAVSHPHALLHVAGELDPATAPVLERALSDLLDRDYQHLDLDLKNVLFCDSAGLQVLIDAHGQLRGRQGTLVLHDPCPSLQTLLSIFGLDPTLHRR